MTKFTLTAFTVHHFITIVRTLAVVSLYLGRQRSALDCTGTLEVLLLLLVVVVVVIRLITEGVISIS